MIDPANRDLVHHLLMYECNPTAVFDDNNLPDGLCNLIYNEVSACAANIATGWAVGGDEVSFQSSLFIRKGACLNRLWNFQRLLDIQLEVILKLNIIWFKCIMIIQKKHQVSNVMNYRLVGLIFLILFRS